MSARMGWEETFEAIKAIGDASLRMRKPGDWYVSQSGVEVKVGPVLEGRYGNGQTPQAAVLDHWKKLTSIDLAKEVVVLDAMRDTRRHVWWNGYRWVEVPLAAEPTDGGAP